jgi:hypothetical protein
VTETFRTKFEGEAKFNTVKTAWIELVPAIREILSGVSFLSGTSVNLEDHVFVGIIGWDGIKVRKHGLT